MANTRFFITGKVLQEALCFCDGSTSSCWTKGDAASVWLEDIAASSCKICLRELQNYAGSHEDIYVVSKEFDVEDDYLEKASR